MMTSLATLSQNKAVGMDVPHWALATLPPGGKNAAKCDPKARACGGRVTPSGQIMYPWRSAWRPWGLSPNPNRIMPEQHSVRSYAYYNTAYNSQFQPNPRSVSSSGRFATTPVQYSMGAYTFVNPSAGSYR